MQKFVLWIALEKGSSSYDDTLTPLWSMIGLSQPTMTHRKLSHVMSHVCADILA